MIIENITHDPTHNMKNVKLMLDYDELRCITNSLYELARLAKDSNSDIKLDSKFDETRRNFIMLFSLTKQGCLPEFELRNMYNLLPSLPVLASEIKTDKE